MWYTCRELIVTTQRGSPTSSTSIYACTWLRRPLYRTVSSRPLARSARSGTFVSFRTAYRNNMAKNGLLLLCINVFYVALGSNKTILYLQVHFSKEYALYNNPVAIDMALEAVNENSSVLSNFTLERIPDVIDSQVSVVCSVCSSYLYVFFILNTKILLLCD